MKRLHFFILILTTSPSLGRGHRLGAPHGDGQGVGGPHVERQMRRLFNDDSETIEDIFYGDKMAKTKWWNGKVANGKAEEQQDQPYASTNQLTARQGREAANPVERLDSQTNDIDGTPSWVTNWWGDGDTTPTTPDSTPSPSTATIASPPQQQVSMPGAPISQPVAPFGQFTDWFPHPAPASEVVISPMSSPGASPPPLPAPTIQPLANVYPGSGTLVVVSNSGRDHDIHEFGRCEGDCDDDDDCFGALVCYQRDGSLTAVPGCLGGGEPEMDYCIDPMDNPSSVNEDTFRLKLYYEEGYKWQEKDYEYEKFCVQCFGGRCDEGEDIRVTKSDSENTKFQFINQDDKETQLYIPADDKCLEARPGEKNWRVEKCDTSNVSQRFGAGPDGNFNGERFELRPLSVATLDVCMTQRHHPKDDEIIFQETCETARNDRTSYWNKY